MHGVLHLAARRLDAVTRMVARVPAVLVPPDERASLHLEAQQSARRVQYEEVELALRGWSPAGTRENQATGMEDRPGFGQLPLQRGEHATLGLRGVCVRLRWEHAGHLPLYMSCHVMR